MSKNLARIMFAAACGTALALAYSATAGAQSQPQGGKQRSTPQSFPWEYGKDGKPVRKSRVVTNPDGSTREEVPQGGKCVRIIERTADGVKRTDQC